MFFLIVFLTGLFIVIGTGVLSAISDVKGLRIPNIHTVIVGSVFFIVFVILSIGNGGYPFSSLVSHLIGAAIFFVVTLVLFAFRMLGAGDSKLGTAFALWAGLKGLFPLVVYMTIAGGVLAIITVILQKYKPFKASAHKGWLASIQAGEGHLPYGIAIVIGALASFAKVGYFNIETLRLFVTS